MSKSTFIDVLNNIIYFCIEMNEVVCGNEIVGWGAIKLRSDINKVLTITLVEN
jgi:hypothetical protein